MDIKHIAEGVEYDLTVVAADDSIHVGFGDDDGEEFEFEFSIEAARELRDALDAALRAAR
jgi:hypothetical protein